jgi:hypothetical protein
VFGVVAGAVAGVVGVGSAGFASGLYATFLWYILADKHNTAAAMASQKVHRKPVVTVALTLVSVPMKPIGIAKVVVPFKGTLTPKAACRINGNNIRGAAK